MSKLSTQTETKDRHTILQYHKLTDQYIYIIFKIHVGYVSVIGDRFNVHFKFYSGPSFSKDRECYPADTSLFRNYPCKC